jgi:hypothetical protein
MIAVTSWIIDTGTTLGGLGGLVAAVGVYLNGKRLKKETTPNGGSSMKDSLNRIEATQAQLIEGQNDLKIGQARHDERLREHDGRLKAFADDMRHLALRVDHHQDR